jgi:Tfp pilus assembly protein PilN
VRPVNLTPPEERRGERAPTRTGGLAYVVVGALAVAVAAVGAVVLTNNQISSRKSNVTSLNAQLTQVTVQAQRLQSYAAFAQNEQARFQTVRSLALSRFDWHRVLHELSLVIPNDVWLTSLSGKVSPQATSAGTSSSSDVGSDALTSITGPSLEIDGCAASHEAVAGFIGDAKAIDGVTRVVVTSSDRASRDGTTGGTTTGTGPGCAVRGFIVSFHATLAFDNVPIDATTGLVAPPQESATTPTTSTGSPSLASARGQERQYRQSAKQQTNKAHQAMSTLIPGVVHP